MDRRKLKGYAELIAGMGVNVRKGQEVFIDASLDQPEFVAMLVEACYKRGASRVVVDWNYQPLTKLRYRYEPMKVLSEVTGFEEARLAHYTEKLPCRIYLESDDPDGLRGVNQRKMALSRQRRYPVIKSYRDQIENRYQWCIAAVPGKAWAKKLFPGSDQDEAVEKLWEAILYTSRALDDPIAAWEEHNRDVHDRCAYLNSLGIRKLNYRSSNGTDITVGMIPEAMFCGASETTLNGITFNPNIPSEEIFISPMRGRAEGVVYASKPLSYQGELIEDFSVTFRKGRAVSWQAGRNEELLTHLITMDEGSAYLGECALVPCDSPISRSGMLFYNTLFDENAACHLAFGMGFADTIRDFDKYSLEECRKLGVNDSMVHVDFMIGTADMEIDAILDSGRKKAIFREGKWAF